VPIPAQKPGLDEVEKDIYGHRPSLGEVARGVAHSVSAKPSGAMSHSGGKPDPGRRTTSPSGSSVPSYTGLGTVGRVYTIAGQVCFALGAICILVALFSSIRYAAPYVRGGGIEMAWTMFLSRAKESLLIGVAALLIGMALVAGGQVLLAFRDIARNSFWWKNLY
jgi:hypothetical protein